VVRDGSLFLDNFAADRCRPGGADRLRARRLNERARGHKKCPPQFRVRARVGEGGAYFLALFAAFFCFGLFFAGFLVALRAFWVFAMGKLEGLRPGLGAAEAIG
jgi:hypothetical protein